MKEFTVAPGDRGQTLIKYLSRILPKAGNGFFYKMLRKKNITLNGKKAEGNEKLCEGDLIKIFVSDDTFMLFSDDAGLDISKYEKAYDTLKGIFVIYEDENVLILDKPKGILSQSDINNPLSANEWAVGYLLNSGFVTEKSLEFFMPSVCNRLDRNTEGLVLCSKTLFGASRLSELLKSRDLSKLYTALVYGNVNKEIDSVLYLSKDSSINKVEISSLPKDGYIEIHTKIYPVAYNPQNNISRVKIHLLTGKSHQIRATLKHLGFPIVGDRKYTDERCLELNESLGIKSQILIADHILFPKMEDYLELSDKEIVLKDSKLITDLMGK